MQDGFGSIECDHIQSNLDLTLEEQTDTQQGQEVILTGMDMETINQGYESLMPP